MSDASRAQLSLLGANMVVWRLYVIEINKFLRREEGTVVDIQKNLSLEGRIL